MYKGLEGRLSTSNEMSVVVYKRDREFVNEPWDEKKARVAEPPTTTLITGAVANKMKDFAQLHAVLMRIAYAEEEYGVMGLDIDAVFSLEEMKSCFEETFVVLRRDSVEKVHPLLMPISRKALDHVEWVIRTIFHNLDMIARSLVFSIGRAKFHIRDAIAWD